MRSSQARTFWRITSNNPITQCYQDSDDEDPNQTLAGAGCYQCRYVAHMLPALLRRACHPVLVGDAVFTAVDVVGIDNAEQWQSGAVVRYRSRRTLMDIVIDPTFKEPHHFKMASLTKTIAFPIEPQFNLTDPGLLLALPLVAITALLDAFLLKPARRIDD